MKVFVVGREASDYGREVRDWMRDYERATRVQPEWMDPDSPEGERFCRAREIMQYPTVVVVDEDMGRVVEMWPGTPLPPIDTVSYYA